MGKVLDELLAQYGDPIAAKDTAPQQNASAFDPDVEKRIRRSLIRGKWKEEKGRDLTQGEMALVDSGGEGIGPEDLRQHRELLTWLGSTNEDIDKALEQSGSYKLEKTPESAKDWGLPKMALDEAKRVGGIAARPAKELFTGHPINALKEAALIGAETLTGVGGERDLMHTPRAVAGEGVSRLLGAAREGVQGLQSKIFVKPGEAIPEAGKAFWKQLTEGGDEQQKKLAETMRLNKQAGENALISEHANDYRLIPNYSTLLGQAADPINYVGFGLMGKAGKLLGIKASKLGLESKVVSDVGDALAQKIGTQQEKWAGQLGKQAGAEVYDSLVQNNVKAAMGKEQLAIDVAKAFTKPEVFDFLKKIPFVGESGAKSITNTLRAIPLIGKKFGVTSAEHPDLMKAIEGIKEIDPSGKILFGTETRTGSGVTRVGAQEAEAAYNALSPSGQRAARWFADFREQQKAILGITSDIEGYFPHVWEEGLFGAGGGKVALSTQKAKGILQRAIEEGKGYIENPEKAILSRYGEIIGKEAYNDAVTEIAKHVTEPIPASGIVPEGYTVIPALKATRSGRAVAQMGGGKMIRKDLYDELVRYTEGAKSVGGLKGAVHKLGNFFKSNLLLAPGTVATNLIGGAAQLSGKITENMAHAMMGNVKPLMNDISALVGALRPGNIEKIRPELWGGKSALFSEVGKAGNPLTKLINAGLAPFSAVENYFKRVIALSELGAKGLKGLTKEQIAAQKGLLGELNKAIDTYAFNYDNVPKFLKDARESWWGWAVMPFPTYGYKLSRYYSRYFAALNPFALMEPADRAARLMTLSALGGAGLAVTPGQDRKHIEGMTSQVDTTGRSKIGMSGDKELWLRTIKYPWANLGHAARGVDALLKGDEDVLGNVAGEFIAEGPLIEGIKVAAGWGNRYEVYKPKGLRAGEIAAGFIPGTRLTQGAKAMEGGERVLPTNFTDAVLNAIPFTGMQGKVQQDRVTKKKVLLDPNIEAMKFWLGLSMKEIDPARYSKERQGKLKAAITAISDAKDIPSLNKAVDRLEDIDPAKLATLANQIKAKSLRLDNQSADIVEGIMAKERVKQSVSEGMQSP